jgi:hypothetical protein
MTMKAKVAAMPNSAARTAVHGRGAPKRVATNMPNTNATTCPTSVNSRATATTVIPTAAHHPIHAGRQRCGFAAVSAPSTATAP